MSRIGTRWEVPFSFGTLQAAAYGRFSGRTAGIQFSSGGFGCVPAGQCSLYQEASSRTVAVRLPAGRSVQQSFDNSARRGLAEGLAQIARGALGITI